MDSGLRRNDGWRDSASHPGSPLRAGMSGGGVGWAEGKTHLSVPATASVRVMMSPLLHSCPRNPEGMAGAVATPVRVVRMRALHQRPPRRFWANAPHPGSTWVNPCWIHACKSRKHPTFVDKLRLRRHSTVLLPVPQGNRVHAPLTPPLAGGLRAAGRSAGRWATRLPIR